jgi:hypothetical protein
MAKFEIKKRELTSKNWDTNKTCRMLTVSDHGRKNTEMTELEILNLLTIGLIIKFLHMVYEYKLFEKKMIK